MIKKILIFIALLSSIGCAQYTSPYPRGNFFNYYDGTMRSIWALGGVNGALLHYDASTEIDTGITKSVMLKRYSDSETFSFLPMVASNFYTFKDGEYIELTPKMKADSARYAIRSDTAKYAMRSDTSKYAKRADSSNYATLSGFSKGLSAGTYRYDTLSTVDFRGDYSNYSGTSNKVYNSQLSIGYDADDFISAAEVSGSNLLLKNVSNQTLAAVSYPSLTGYATQSWVNTQLSNYTTTDDYNSLYDAVFGSGQLSDRVSSLEIAGYQTSSDVSGAISAALSGYATESWSNNTFATITDYNSLYDGVFNQGGLSDRVSALESAGYTTSSEVSSQISTALSGYASQSWVSSQLNNYTTTTSFNSFYDDVFGAGGLSDRVSSLETSLSNSYYTKSQVDAGLALKANSAHGHWISDVTNLQTTLDNLNTADNNMYDAVFGSGALADRLSALEIRVAALENP